MTAAEMEVISRARETLADPGDVRRADRLHPGPDPRDRHDRGHRQTSRDLRLLPADDRHSQPGPAQRPAGPEDTAPPRRHHDLAGIGEPVTGHQTGPYHARDPRPGRPAARQQPADALRIRLGPRPAAGPALNGPHPAGYPLGSGDGQRRPDPCGHAYRDTGSCAQPAHDPDAHPAARHHGTATRHHGTAAALTGTHPAAGHDAATPALTDSNRPRTVLTRAAAPRPLAQRGRRVTAVARILTALALLLGSLALLAGVSPAAHAATTTAHTASGQYFGARVLDKAETRTGDWYLYGAAGPTTFDCSGLVYWSALQLGTGVPHNTGAMLADSRHFYRIPVSDAQRGDLMFFGTGHVEIMTAWYHTTFGAQHTGTRVGWHQWSAYWHPTMALRWRA
jgi:peptidoglycan DL-endopeptidase CwlO